MPRCLAVVACLGFTGAGVAWADPAPSGPEQTHIEYVENPYAPHVTNGSTVRLGTSIGFLHGQAQDVMAIGGTLDVGHRFGRFAIEAELGLAQLDSDDHTDTHLGSQEQLGVIGRYDVLRVGSRYMGANSMMAVYVEGGAAQVWTQWDRSGPTDGSRMVPDNAGHVAGQAGFGVLFEHRLQEPITIPRRVGWYLGWRASFSPHDADAMSICRAESCRTVVASPSAPAGTTDHALLFQSSLQMTW